MKRVNMSAPLWKNLLNIIKICIFLLLFDLKIHGIKCHEIMLT